MGLLTGLNLNRAVAMALGYSVEPVDECGDVWIEYHNPDKYLVLPNYDTDIAVSWPIIVANKISIVWAGSQWCATYGSVAEVFQRDGGNHFQGTGDDPLIAALRCFVAKVYGDSIDLLTEG